MRQSVPDTDDAASPSLSSELSDAEELEEENEELGLDEEEFETGAVVDAKIADDDDEDDEEDDEEDEDDGFQELDDEELPISEDESNYKIEDLDEMDEDLELRPEEEEEEEEEIQPERRGPRKLTLKLSPDKKRESALKNMVPPTSRETRKRQLTFYEEDDGEGDDQDDDDDDDEEEEERYSSAKKHRRLPARQVKPTDLDADLILTDEETEYDPHANPDISKMTERQRSRYLEEETVSDNNSKFVELKDVKKGSGKKKESDEIIALRKAESARRREDYKNKQMEEEKKDTLNKLLKRRANKTRDSQDHDGDDPSMAKSGLKQRRPIRGHAAFIRYTNNITTLQGNSVLSMN